MARDNTKILEFLESQVRLNRHGTQFDTEWNAALYYNHIIDEHPQISNQTSMTLTPLREIRLMEREVIVHRNFEVYSPMTGRDREYTLKLKGAVCNVGYGKLYAYFAYDELRDCVWFFDENSLS